MTRFIKSLSDLFRGIKRLPTWKIVAIVSIFLLMTILTFGGSAVGVALLYMWGDTGKYSGRAGAVTYTKRGVRRNQVNPSNPRSSLQVAIRNLLKGFSSDWRSLSFADQTTWKNISLKKSNRMGVSHDVKGKNLYVMLNTLLGMIGVAPNVAAPNLKGQQAPEIDEAASATNIDVSSNAITIGTINTPMASAGFVLYASLPIPGGRSKGRTRAIYFGNDATAYVAADAWTAYLAVMGYTPQVGDVITLELQWINNTTGEDGGRGLANRVTVQA